jgi:tape measure domain-containing protein
MEVTSRANLIIGLKDEASKEARKLAADLARLNTEAAGVKTAAERASGASGGGGLTSMVGSMKNLGMTMLGAMGVYTSLTQVATAMVQTGQRAMMLGQEAEQTAMAFETMLGSVDAAKEHLDELRSFAAKTPFEFRDLVNSSKQLQAFGFEAKNVVPMLRDVGDAVAAMGGSSHMIDTVTRALGQMQAKGRVSGEELLQLTEQGVPALRYLAEAAGMSTGEMQKLVSKGLIPASDGIQDILAGMREDFGGMMARQAETATGKLSNLQDAWDSLLTTIGSETTQATSEAAVAITGLVSSVDVVLKTRTDAFTKYAAYGGMLVSNFQRWTGDLNAANATQAEVLEYLETHTDRVVHKYGAMAKAAESARWDGIAEQWAGAARVAATAQGELMEKFEGTSLAVQNLSSLMRGELGNAEDQHAVKMEELIGRQGELAAEIEKATGQHGQYYEFVQESSMSQAALTLTTLQLAEAQKKLAEETDPLKQAQLQVSIERMQGEISGATTVVSGYVDKSKEIGELTGEYDEVTEAIKEQEIEHAKATRSILFNILQQQLANLGLLDEGGPALIEIAKRWGLIDEATAEATQGMIGGIKDAAENENWDLLVQNAEDVRLAYLGIPTEIKTVHTFETRYVTAGKPPSAGEAGIENWTGPKTGSSNSTVVETGDYTDGSDGRRAFGGPMRAGGRYLTQESIYTRPEVFVPGTSGAMLTRQQTQAIGLSLGQDRQSDVAAAIRTLPDRIGREIRTAVQFALVRT